ncbi:hypothetical protein [Mucilaginibacter sp.]|uniref:hypothetical protein n=1 Tax=Mucilaginibacter sp. TaxID=1882438 RepID=UPI0035BC72F5
MKGICRLCQQEKDLIRRSHIWPDFMYKGMYDDKGRLYVINSSEPAKHRTVQSGSYEQHIFCSDCDNVRIGQLERYASNNLYRKPYLEENAAFKQISVPGGIQVIHCEDLNYNQFKLFLLSLLWRASISTEAVFENFKLGEDEEEFLRASIYEKAVVDEMAFPCVLLTSGGAALDENFIAVDAFKTGLVKFYINAFVYTFYLAENKKDETTRQLAIGMDQKMGIMKVSIAQWNLIRNSIIEATIAASNR